MGGEPLHTYTYWKKVIEQYPNNRLIHRKQEITKKLSSSPETYAKVTEKGKSARVFVKRGRGKKTQDRRKQKDNQRKEWHQISPSVRGGYSGRGRQIQTKVYIPRKPEVQENELRSEPMEHTDVD